MQEKVIRIGILGDICPIDNINPFRFTLSCDYLLGNLECVLVDEPYPIKKAGPILYAPTAFSDTLRAFGFDALSLANNHIRDCGEEGVESTINACIKSQLRTFGAGKTIDHALKPLIIEKNGVRVGLISFAEREFNYATEDRAGAAYFEPYDSFDIIKGVRETVDVLIVLYHGGIENYIYPSPLLKKKCHKMVDAGADVVLCQHSHCIGTRERYQGSEILYGQGNSIFGFRKGNDIWNHGLIATAEIQNGIVNVKYDVLETSQDGTVGYASVSTKNAVLQRLEIESKKINDDSFLLNEWERYCNGQKALYFPMLFGLGKNMNRLNRLLRNRLIKAIYSPQKMNVVHNIIRCEAHKEVLETILHEFDF